MSERWLPVVGREGVYEVSDRGRIASVARRLPDGRMWRRRLLTPIRMDSGHLSVNLANPKQFRTVHSIVLEAFVGPRPDGMQGLHWNDVPDDNRLSNLRWGTSSQNRLDSVRNGRHWASQKLACPYGHQLVMPNLRKYALARHGHRACLACHRTRARLRRSQLPFDPALADETYDVIMQGVSR